jgi:hypothetical protein
LARNNPCFFGPWLKPSPSFAFGRIGVLLTLVRLALENHCWVIFPMINWTWGDVSIINGVMLSFSPKKKMDGFPIFSQKIRWIYPFIISALLCRKVNGLTWPIFDALPTGKKNLLMGISKHSITIYGQRKN